MLVCECKQTAYEETAVSQTHNNFVSIAMSAAMALGILTSGPVFSDKDKDTDTDKDEGVTELPAAVQWMGNIQSADLDESSGLASSHRDAGVLWSMNDSGSGPQIFALTPQGRHLGSWLIDMPDPIDWEAMASFQWQNKSYLLVADIGDNFAVRSTVSFTIIAEPQLAQISPEERLQPLVTTHFTFPDGPRDAEAVAVDTQRQELLVLSKRTVPPELFRVPLNMASLQAGESAGLVASTGSSDVVRAELLAALTDFRRPTKSQVDLYGPIWPFIGMPTGMSLSGNRLLVSTLEHAYLFDRQNLTEPAKLIQLPLAGQREAIAFAKDSWDTAYVTHEREDGLRKAAVYRVQFQHTDRLE